MKQLKQLNPRQINTTALAYIGDAVYEIYVRERVLAASGGNSVAAAGALSGAVSGQRKAFGAHVDALHRQAIRYVRAEGQAKAVKAMLAEGFLTAEEEAIVKRARNHKSASKPKNADAMDYKYATAFEALIGFWHLMARRGDSVGTESPAQGLPAGSEQPLPAAAGTGGGRRRAEEIIFRAFEIIEGVDHPKISERK